MKPNVLSVCAWAGLLAIVPLRAADDLITQLATCQVSWMDWKDDPVKGKQLAETFNAGFARSGADGSWAPKKPALVVGLPVVRAYPESVGMGVGFSVVLDAPFDKARDAVQKAVGKTLKDCETSDGMRTCGLEIAPQRTIAVMSGDDGKSKQTLVGCYYFYAK